MSVILLVVLEIMLTSDIVVGCPAVSILFTCPGAGNPKQG